MVQLLLAIIYISFISLGLPDGLLGAAWPTMYVEFGAPVSYAGIISMIISVGTIISSLSTDYLTYKLGTGRLTALSVALTAAALLGFSMSHSFLALCVLAIPYGLGAGSVDAALNSYVALHYSSRHMSWLHCMWGVGAMTGPYIMGHVLSTGQPWNNGYMYVGLLQIALSAVLLLSLPMWKKRSSAGSSTPDEPVPIREVIRIKGAKEMVLTFFCYCGLEQTAGLWASSYLVLYKGVPAVTAASFASMFYIGLTTGRGLNGFLTMKFSDTQLIRMGMGVILAGITVMLLPLSEYVSLAGLILVGLGCAPVYPSVIHSTPYNFGERCSQALISLQMACAYVGTCLMPPLFGLIANHISVSLLPVFLLALLIGMCLMHENMLKRVRAAHGERA